MNVLAWILQIFLAVQFLFHGWLFISPPAMMVDAIAGMGLSTWFGNSSELQKSWQRSAW